MLTDQKIAGSLQGLDKCTNNALMIQRCLPRFLYPQQLSHRGHTPARVRYKSPAVLCSPMLVLDAIPVQSLRDDCRIADVSELPGGLRSAGDGDWRHPLSFRRRQRCQGEENQHCCVRNVEGRSIGTRKDVSSVTKSNATYIFLGSGGLITVWDIMLVLPRK